MNDRTLKKEDLLLFGGGTSNWYKHSLVRDVTYTDGVRHVAIAGGAYWLVDEIAIAQMNRRVRAEGFQVWTLKKPGVLVAADKSTTLTCEDGNGNVVTSNKIPYTDFPLDEITLWCVNKVIMLPSEY